MNPAARIWINPYDAERARLQEAVLDAVLTMYRENPSLEPLLAATEALIQYTAPKHKPESRKKQPAPARRRREDRVLPKKAAKRSAC